MKIQRIRKIHTKVIALICLLAVCIANFSTMQQNFLAEESFSVNAKSAVLMDYATGEILYDQNGDAKLQIASMVKLMTIYLTTQSLEKNTLKLTDKLEASENASGMGGSQVFIDANAVYTVEQMLKSVIMSSANDASVALAEKISGNEKSFVNLMNKTAKEIGMTNTLYANCTGLPAPMQHSTAKDTAILLSKLAENEIYKSYSSIWIDELTHPSGRKTELVNTNKLVRYFKGCDCGKTGSTDEAGYCLSASAERDGMRLISVVMGTTSSKERFAQSTVLLNYGFNNYENQEIINKENSQAKATILKSLITEVDVFAEQSFSAVVRKGEEKTFEIVIRLDENLVAPLQAEQKVGSIIISKNGKQIKEIALILKSNIPALTLKDSIKKIIERF